MVGITRGAEHARLPSTPWKRGSAPVAGIRDTAHAIRPGRNRALDGLRGIAVLGVIGFHSWGQVLPGGAAGVDVFFVLSGFLITGLLIKEHERSGAVSLSGFYARRAWRLLPALACVIVVVGVVSLGAPASARGHNLTGILASATYSSDWVMATRGSGSLGVLGHTWSLAVEEQFYLLWPLILVPLLRIGGPRLVVVVSGVGVLLVVVARVLVLGHGGSFDRVYYAADLHADPILLGCCLAGLRHAGFQLTRRAADLAGLAALAALAMLFAAPQIIPPAPFGFTAGAVASAALIVASLDGRWVGRILSLKPLALVGLVSYALYLWSPLVAAAVGWRAVPAGPLTLAVVLAGSLAVAAASWRLMEGPIAARRRPAAAQVPA